MKLIHSRTMQTTLGSKSSCSQKRRSFAVHAIVLALALALSCLPLAGCGSNSSATSAASSVSSSQTTSEQSAAGSSSSGSVADQAGISVTVNVKGDHDDVSVEEASELTLDEGATALDALKDTGLVVEITESSFGPYVVSIEGLAASGSNGWTYSVNGEMPSVSANDYVLEDGDTVDWSYYVA